MPHYAGRCRVLAGYKDERRDIAVAVAHAAADRVARRLGQHTDRTDRLEAQYQLGRADARAARERIEAFLGKK